MANLTNHENIHYFFKNNVTVEAISDGITRWGYETNTVYITNPGGAEITVQVSPNGVDWFDAAATLTDTTAIVHVQLLCKFMRVKRGAGAGSVTAVVCSGSLAHT